MADPLKLLLCLLASTTLIASGSVRVEAAEPPKADDVVLSLQRCTGKWTFFERTLVTRLPSETSPSCNKDALESWAAAKDLRIVWEDDFLVILPASNGVEYGARRWNRLQLSVSATSRAKDGPVDEEGPVWNYKFIPVRGQISEKALGTMKAWVLGNVPMPPVSFPAYCDTCPHDKDFRVAKLNLSMQFEMVKLGPKEPQRIVGWVCSDSFCHVILGQLDQSDFHPAWISPLTGRTHGEGPTVTYRDVNGDGIGEIWVYSRMEAGNQWGEYLSVFDIAGRELTRDAGECGALEGNPPDVKPDPSYVCPIWGVPGIQHYFEDDESGRLYLEAFRDIRGSEKDSLVYRFRGGKFVLSGNQSSADNQEAASGQPEPDSDAAGLNEQGMRLMQQKKFAAAAAKFVEASARAPKNTPSAALFANNAGFAYYKMEKYDQAVSWLRVATAADPRRAVAYLNLGDACGKLGLNAEAREAYKKYLELAPDSKSAAEVIRKLNALPAAAP